MCHRDVVFSVEAYGEDASDRLIAADAVASSQRDIAMKLALPVLLAALIGSLAHAQTTQDNRRDVVLWYEAFDQKNPALLDQILAPEWVDIPSPPGVPPGGAAILYQSPRLGGRQGGGSLCTCGVKPATQ